MSKYVVQKWREREADWFVCCEKRQNGKSEGREEYSDQGGLLATQGHYVFQAQATAKSHVWVYVAIQKAGSVLISMVHVATRGHTEAQDLGHTLWNQRT